jgi:xanthine dehydrogenase small subunit
MDGNICRCTGYKSIERAASRVTALLQDRQLQDPASYAAEKQLLPAYFKDIRSRLQTLALQVNGNGHPAADAWPRVGGGTDLYVQQPERMQTAAVEPLLQQPALQGIRQVGSRCLIGGAATVTDVGESSLLRSFFPDLPRYLRLVSSTPIRNMATLAGNFVNASPIGDFTIMFLALDATLVLSAGNQSRELPLRHFYKGYKLLDKKPEEMIREIWFELPGPGAGFNFEKVSKRTHLDIASVNSAMALRLVEGRLQQIHISAGGVGPVPQYLAQTAAFLKGKDPGEAVFRQALEMAQEEVAPISDARGTAVYKRLLLNQLLKAHFLTLLPGDVLRFT